MTPWVLIALDSVGVDPLGHDRPDSVYAHSSFLFPRGARGPALDLPQAPREGLLVETDVTGGREHGAIECALTYTTLFSGIDALERHGLMEGLGLRSQLLEEALAEQNLFRHFERPCLANAIFPAQLSFLRGSYVRDLVPELPRPRFDAELRWRGEPIELRGPAKRGFAELFTVAEINSNVFVHAAREAGVRLRTWDDLRAGRALSATLTHELENEFALEALDQAPLPLRSPSDAAAILAALSRQHDFVFYKFQLADLVSHTGRVDLARDVFALIETFLRAFLEAAAPETRVVVTSDHGHLEQVAFTQGHPKSRVPTWSFGAGAQTWGRGLTHPAEIFKLLTT